MLFLVALESFVCDFHIFFLIEDLNEKLFIGVAAQVFEIVVSDKVLQSLW